MECDIIGIDIWLDKDAYINLVLVNIESEIVCLWIYLYGKIPLLRLLTI